MNNIIKKKNKKVIAEEDHSKKTQFYFQYPWCTLRQSTRGNQ